MIRKNQHSFDYDYMIENEMKRQLDSFKPSDDLINRTLERMRATENRLENNTPPSVSPICKHYILDNPIKKRSFSPACAVLIASGIVLIGAISFMLSRIAPSHVAQTVPTTSLSEESIQVIVEEKEDEPIVLLSGTAGRSSVTVVTQNYVPTANDIAGTNSRRINNNRINDERARLRALYMSNNGQQ